MRLVLLTTGGPIFINGIDEIELIKLHNNINEVVNSKDVLANIIVKGNVYAILKPSCILGYYLTLDIDKSHEEFQKKLLENQREALRLFKEQTGQDNWWKGDETDETS